MKQRVQTFGWAMVLAMLLVLIWFVHGALIHAQTPTVIISPNGSITYVYPGTPAVAIAPQGGITYIYPGVLPSMPVLPSVPVLPPILTPLPSYSYGGPKP